MNYFDPFTLRFFIDVKEYKLSELNVLNTVEKLTENKPNKLQALLNDFEIFVSIEQDKYTQKEVVAALKKLKKEGKKIPYITIEGKKHIDTNKLLYPNGFQGCNEFMILLKNLIAEHSKSTKTEGKTKKDYQDTLWFKVGLMFATGKMQKLLEKHGDNFTHVAKELGNISYRPFISDTQGAHAKGDKNIYGNQKKLQQIQAYCIKNNIIPVPDFLKHIKSTDT